MTVEVWKSVVGFEGYYQVSNLGQVRSVDRVVKHKGVPNRQNQLKGQELKLKLSQGYHRVGLRKNSEKQRMYPVHRLVATAFIENAENKPVVNHIDGIKLHNNVENLEWATVKENTIHAFDTGLRIGPRGVKQGHAKLSPDLICKAKALRDAGNSYSCIGKLTGVSTSTIYNALVGKTWKYSDE